MQLGANAYIRVMTSHIALVKNMVCHRCVMAVEGILDKAGIPFHKVVIGEIYLEQPLNEKQKATLSSELKHIGFELIGNHMTGLIEKIKQHTIRKARNEVGDAEKKHNLSRYLSDKLNYEYTHLSSLFSSVEGRTIENFYIEHN